MKFRSLSAALTLLAAGYAVAIPDVTPMEISSGSQRVTLVELYTSEGCSSCPPADRWLSDLETDPGLWRDFVPIAFHVDYWDQIGWPDRFASAEYSSRQRRYAAEGGARVVYTPGVFRDGREWLSWRADKTSLVGGKNVGDLNISISGQHVTARFNTPKTYSSDLTLHVALLGMNLETDVRAGENRGKKLHHDFVALGLASAKFETVSGDYLATLQLPGTKQDVVDHALAAWVSDDKSQTPIQSAGGFLP